MNATQGRVPASELRPPLNPTDRPHYALRIDVYDIDALAVAALSQEVDEEWRGMMRQTRCPEISYSFAGTASVSRSE